MQSLDLPSNSNAKIGNRNADLVLFWVPLNVNTSDLLGRVIYDVIKQLFERHA